jgi:hypothetical protein
VIARQNAAVWIHPVIMKYAMPRLTSSQETTAMKIGYAVITTNSEVRDA